MLIVVFVVVGATTVATTREARADRACDLVFLPDARAQTEYLRQVYASDQKLSPGEILEFDRLSAAPQEPGLAELLAAPPSHLQPSDFMLRTGYTRRERDWNRRALSLSALLDSNPDPNAQKFLRIISRRDPHFGVRSAALKILSGFPNPSQDSELALERFFEARDDERGNNPQDVAFDRALEKARALGRSEGAVDPDFLPALTHHLERRGVKFLLDDGPAPRILLRADQATALGRLAAWLKHVFGAIDVVLDPALARATRPNYFEVDGSTLVLPLEVARNPQVLPVGVQGWVRALLVERHARRAFDVEWLGVAYKSPDRPEADESRLGEDRFQLVQIDSTLVDIRAAWESVRDELLVDAHSPGAREAFLALRSLMARQAQHFEILGEALKQIDVAALEHAAELKPQNVGGRLALEFTRGRSPDARYDVFQQWIGATFYLRGKPILAVPVVGLTLVDDSARFAALARHLNVVTESMKASAHMLVQLDEVVDLLERAPTPQERHAIFSAVQFPLNVSGLIEIN